jgi:prepilin-type N-terminal cleavage/methylation domain-containing protein
MHRRVRGEQGFSLIEVMMAIGLFAVVAGMAATSLSSFYVTMDMQQQRVEAVNSCREVLGAIREKRGEFMGANNVFNRAGWLAWITQNNTANWAAFLKVGTDGHVIMDNQKISVTCLNAAGAQAGSGDSPLEVHVMVDWTDRARHPLEAEVVSLLADR